MNFATTNITHTFTTERLSIQKCNPGDADLLLSACQESSTEVFPFLPWCHPDYQLIDATAWLDYCVAEWQLGNLYAFNIWHKTSGRILGGCSLNRIDTNPIANLGYWIRTSELNQGYASEAVNGLINFGLTQVGLLRIEIIMSTKNRASQRVAEKSDGQFEGLLKNRLFLHDQPHDTFLYSVIPKPIVGL
ncbi:MAG: GNAT family N-acetyltransferase [Pseudomonadales bacterium]|nr:GNAT family N-acetyltransferase [Pseudomonadales bacterium]